MISHDEAIDTLVGVIRDLQARCTELDEGRKCTIGNSEIYALNLVSHRPTMAAILSAFCNNTGLFVSDLRSPNPTRATAWPRQDAMRLMRLAGHPPTQIARFFGMNHSTVIKGVARSQARADLHKETKP